MNDTLPNSPFISRERKNSLADYITKELESNKPEQEKITNILAFVLELLNQGKETNLE